MTPSASLREFDRCRSFPSREDLQSATDNANSLSVATFYHSPDAPPPDGSDFTAGREAITACAKA
jgi:hypothetical protein